MHPGDSSGSRVELALKALLDHRRKLRKIPLQAKPIDDRYIYIHSPTTKTRLFKLTLLLNLLNQYNTTGVPLKGVTRGYSIVVDLDGECLAVCREHTYFHWFTGLCALVGSPVCLEKLVDEDHLSILLLNHKAFQKTSQLCIQAKDYIPQGLALASKLKFNGKICFTKYWTPPEFLKFTA